MWACEPVFLYWFIRLSLSAVDTVNASTGHWCCILFCLLFVYFFLYDILPVASPFCLHGHAVFVTKLAVSLGKALLVAPLSFVFITVCVCVCVWYI